MPPFDAQTETNKLNNMAMAVLDEDRPIALSQSCQTLAKEYYSLDASQRLTVGLVMEQGLDLNYPNFSKMPRPFVKLDGNGAVESITFEAGLFDFHNGPSKVSLTVEADKVKCEYASFGPQHHGGK
jgi:hypothetical protein